jgi:hypothetical protein
VTCVAAALHGRVHALIALPPEGSPFPAHDDSAAGCGFPYLRTFTTAEFGCPLDNTPSATSLGNYLECVGAVLPTTSRLCRNCPLALLPVARYSVDGSPTLFHVSDRVLACALPLLPDAALPIACVVRSWAACSAVDLSRLALPFRVTGCDLGQASAFQLAWGRVESCASRLPMRFTIETDCHSLALHAVTHVLSTSTTAHAD